MKPASKPIAPEDYILSVLSPGIGSMPALKLPEKHSREQN
jgi:hypothetical protein